MTGYDKLGLPNVVMKGAAEGYDAISQVKDKIESQKTRTLKNGTKVTEYYDKKGNLLLTKSYSDKGGPSIFQVPIHTSEERCLWTFVDDDSDGNIDFINMQDFNNNYSEWYRSSEDNGWFDMHGREEAAGSKLKQAGKVAGQKAGASRIDARC